MRSKTKSKVTKNNTKRSSKVLTRIKSVRKSVEQFKKKESNKFRNQNRITRKKLDGTIKYQVNPTGLKALIKMDDESINKAINDKIINDKEGVRLIVDKFYTNPARSTFEENISNSEISKLEKMFNNQKCMDEPSLYDLMEPVIHKGLKCRVLRKGSHLYKTLSGFTTDKMEQDFLKEQEPHRPMWFGNKYVSYGFARLNYFGINVYKAVEDIYFIDFNEEIANIIDIIKDDMPSKDIQYLKYCSGYGITLMDQLDMMVREKAHKWGEVWLFTNPEYFLGSYFYCKTLKKNLKMIAISLKGYKIFFDLFKILDKKGLIDGLVVEQLQSYLDQNGLFKHEEFIVSVKVFQKKLKRDTSHPLDWTNWKIHQLDLSDGFLLCDSFSLQTIYDNSLVPNEDFKLIRFWNNNKTTLRPVTGKNYILSYNVHGFKNINQLVKREDNLIDILKLIKYYQNNLVAIALQEVVFKSKSEEDKFVAKLKKYGFRTVYMTPNGLRNSNMKLLMALKYSTRLTPIKHVDFNKRNRNSLLSNINNLKMVATHLTIGEPYLKDSDEYKSENTRIDNFNFHERINQLNNILKNNPDIIFGDFNITSKDDEAKYLREKGYTMINDDKDLSTPYNKVDMIFTKQKNKVKNYKNLKVNYSDHTPFLFQLL